MGSFVEFSIKTMIKITITIIFFVSLRVSSCPSWIQFPFSLSPFLPSLSRQWGVGVSRHLCSSVKSVVCFLPVFPHPVYPVQLVLP